jgi:1-aminocyclopropane-1-carboxylate deaminase
VAQAQVQPASGGNWPVEHGYHFGGYAKRHPDLDRFITGFHDRHGLTLDRIYTAKIMYGILDLAGRGALLPGTTAVAVITGQAGHTEER